VLKAALSARSSMFTEIGLISFALMTLNLLDTLTLHDSR
jgi:hypothetical protein